jgi:hypothetical protein
MAGPCRTCGGPLGRRGRCRRCGAVDGTIHVVALDSDGGGSAADVELGGGAHRWRGVVLGGLAVAMLVGAAVAMGGGGSDPVATPPSTAVTAAATTTVPAPPSTRERARTTLPTFEVGTLNGLAGEVTGTVLYASDRLGDAVSRLHLDTGVVETRRYRGMPLDPQDPTVIIARHDGAVVLPAFFTDVDGIYVPDDPVAITRRVAVTDGVLVLPAADPRLLWALQSWNPSEQVVTLVDLGGTPVAEPFEIPRAAVPAGDDGLGRLVLVSSSGTYLLDPATRLTTRIDDEPALAWTPAWLLTSRCDGALACRLRLVDRGTGEERLGAPLPDTLPDLFPGGPLGLLDPTGRRFAWLGARGLEVVDVLSGDRDEFAAGHLAWGGRFYQPMLWSADGRWLMWPSSDGDVNAWREGFAVPRTIGVDGLVDYSAIALVPG